MGTGPVAALAFACPFIPVALTAQGTGCAVHAVIAPESRRAAADTVTLSLCDVQRMAARQNPSFQAARLEATIARGDLRQARAYRFNPELGLFAPGAAPAGSASPNEFTLTQEVEWAGQRGLRIDAAEIGVTRATAAVRNAGRLTLGDATTAYYRALAADRRLRVAEESLALTERLIRAVRTQLREGEISTLEANLAEIETGRGRGRVLGARRELTSAQLELKRSIGLSPDAEIRLAGDSSTGIDMAQLNADSLVTLALARRPDLAARSAAMNEASALTSLARREVIPNVRLGAVTERNRDGGNARLGLALGLSLPLLNRNRGVVARRRAEAEQARLESRATELAVRTEVTEALRAFRTATEEVRVFEASVLGPARQNTALLETAYNAGKIALTSLLLLRNQLLDAELNYWDAWLARREALVRLDVATATLSLDAASVDDTSARTPR